MFLLIQLQSQFAWMSLEDYEVLRCRFSNALEQFLLFIAFAENRCVLVKIIKYFSKKETKLVIKHVISDMNDSSHLF